MTRIRVNGRSHTIQTLLLVPTVLLLGLWLGRTWLGRAEAAAGNAPAAALLLPADEAAQQAEFFLVRARLQTAIAVRDTAALLAIVHPHIKSSFGDDEGLASFRRRWNLADPASGLWSELGRVLALGGRFRTDTQFAAPYVFSNWPDSLDAFEHVAIAGSDVRVRAAPRLDAEPLTVLSFAIVARAPGSGSGSSAGSAGSAGSGATDAAVAPSFTAVRLPNGRVGYVASAYVRSPIEYRAIFSRENGAWRLTAFIAGD